MHGISFIIISIMYCLNGFGTIEGNFLPNYEMKFCSHISVSYQSLKANIQHSTS